MLFHALIQEIDVSPKFKIDMPNKLLTIFDEQATPAKRIELGRFGAGANYGMKFFQTDGATVMLEIGTTAVGDVLAIGQPLLAAGGMRFDPGGGGRIAWEDNSGVLWRFRQAAVGGKMVFEGLGASANEFSIESALIHGTAQPRARVKRSADKTLTQGTNTVIDWDQEDFDTGALHDNVTNNSRITVPTGGAGVWLIIWRPRSDSGNTYMQWEILKNGATVIARNFETVTGAVGNHFTLTVLDEAVAGDYYEARLHLAGVANPVMQMDSRFEAVKLW